VKPETTARPADGGAAPRSAAGCAMTTGNGMPALWDRGGVLQRSENKFRGPPRLPEVPAMSRQTRCVNEIISFFHIHQAPRHSRARVVTRYWLLAIASQTREDRECKLQQ
jgi:hypothetical protein